MVDTDKRPRPRLVVDNGAAPTAETPDFIADNLRRLFRATEAEPLPQHLRDLLARLAAENGAERAEPDR
jgi:hypothetical protein